MARDASNTHLWLQHGLPFAPASPGRRYNTGRVSVWLPCPTHISRHSPQGQAIINDAAAVSAFYCSWRLALRVPQFYSFTMLLLVLRCLSCTLVFRNFNLMQ